MLTALLTTTSSVTPIALYAYSGGIMPWPMRKYIRDRICVYYQYGSNMASVYDVASYILEKCGTTTAMKLQKLVYYSQAWSLVWDEEPLFDEEIQAWANGPVSPDLYDLHRGQFKVSAISGGDSSKLTKIQKETIEKVLDFYGEKTSQWLSDLTHQEDPWLDARKGLIPGQRGSRITVAYKFRWYGKVWEKC
jgi:uncharacterized phage-associated protein